MCVQHRLVWMHAVVVRDEHDGEFERTHSIVADTHHGLIAVDQERPSLSVHRLDETVHLERPNEWFFRFVVCEEDREVVAGTHGIHPARCCSAHRLEEVRVLQESNSGRSAAETPQDETTCDLGMVERKPYRNTSPTRPSDNDRRCHTDVAHERCEIPGPQLLFRRVHVEVERRTTTVAAVVNQHATTLIGERASELCRVAHPTRPREMSATGGPLSPIT